MSETAKCKCGHTEEEHGMGMEPPCLWETCLCAGYEPAEPVAVPPAPPEIPPSWVDELALRLAEQAYEFVPLSGRHPSQLTAQLQSGFVRVIGRALEGKRA